MAIVKQPWREPNSPCSCGCGEEVRFPGQRYILGHGGSRKAPLGWEKRVIEMWKRKWQYQEIADYFGMSKSRVNQIIGDHIFVQNRSPELIERHKRIAAEKAEHKAIWRKPTEAEQKQIDEEESWKTARRQHKTVKRYLQNLNRSQSPTAACERELILLN